MAAREEEIGRLVVRLLGDSKQFQAMMHNAQVQSTKTAQHTERMGKRVEKIGPSLGKAALAIGGVTTATLAMSQAIRGSIAAYAEFDQAMIESTSIMQTFGNQTEHMRNLALSLSEQAPQAASELARSYFFLASAGLSAEQSMAALPQVMKFATAGAFDMAQATDLLTDAQSALGLTVRDDAFENARNMQRVSDVLVKANTLANASVQQFSEALTNEAGAAIKNYRKDVEEGVAVLAAFADQGVKANVAGSGLGRLLRLLGKTALDNAKQHEALGFAVYDTSGRMRNMADIIENLENILRGMSDESRVATLDMLGFQARVQQVILPLIGASDAIRDYEEKLREAGGTTAEVADKQLKSFSNEMKTLWNTIKNMGIEIGETLAPVIRDDLGPAVKDLTVHVADLVKTAGPLIKLVGLTTKLTPLFAILREKRKLAEGTRPSLGAKQFGGFSAEHMEAANRKAMEEQQNQWFRFGAYKVPYTQEQISRQREKDEQERAQRTQQRWSSFMGRFDPIRGFTRRMGMAYAGVARELPGRFMEQARKDQMSREAFQGILRRQQFIASRPGALAFELAAVEGSRGPGERETKQERMERKKREEDMVLYTKATANWLGKVYDQLKKTGGVSGVELREAGLPRPAGGAHLNQ